MQLKHNTFFSGEMWPKLENADTTLSSWILFFIQILQVLAYTIWEIHLIVSLFEVSLKCS